MSCPLRAYPRYHRMTAGDLYAAGFRVWGTFRNPSHYDVELAEPTAAQVGQFLAVAGPLKENRHYVAEQ
jgi:hypothetical protein